MFVAGQQLHLPQEEHKLQISRTPTLLKRSTVLLDLIVGTVGTPSILGWHSRANGETARKLVLRVKLSGDPASCAGERHVRRVCGETT